MTKNSALRLTPHQAYLCMFEFLSQYDERGPTDEIGGLLGAMSLLPDGQPADAAYAADWSKAVATVLAAEAEGGYTKAAFRLRQESE